MKTFIFIIISFMSIAALSAKDKVEIDVRTVDSLDIDRYMGRWYEIVRFDTWFENGVDHVTAHYTMKPNGHISIVNRSCKNGKMRRSTAKAKRSAPETPGKLRVSSFLWFYSDYNILELDHDGYTYAVIGSKNGNYFWVLSRTPYMAPETLGMLLKCAKKRGYDLKRLVFCNQSEPRPEGEFDK